MINDWPRTVLDFWMRAVIPTERRLGIRRDPDLVMQAALCLLEGAKPHVVSTLYIAWCEEMAKLPEGMTERV